jgi:hypothetical protein
MADQLYMITALVVTFPSPIGIAAVLIQISRHYQHFRRKDFGISLIIGPFHVLLV